MNKSLLFLATLLASTAWAGEPVPATAAPVAAPAPAVPLISQDDLLARQAKHDAKLFVLDVRTPEEFAQGHVPGAVNIPHDQVSAHLGDIPKDKDVVLYCRSGRRAGMAAEVLKANGYDHLLHLDGDMNAWMEKARPMQAKAPAGAMQN